jgi:glutathione synthase/RimK-type ligase-like ATP-grasp enzyme
MILIVGTLVDPGAAYLCTRLLAREADFLLFDTRLYPRQFQLEWSLYRGKVEGWLRTPSRQVPLAELRSVWLRWLAVPGTEHGRPEQGITPDQQAALDSLVTFLNHLPALVANRPAAGISNGSKPYQQQIIAQHGFAVPRTLVTTVPEEARQFYEVCDGRVIYKSVSAVRSIVTRLTTPDLERLDQLRGCPTQFQEYIPGVDIRVHTVGDRLFASEIVTDATDYRYAGRQGAAREMRPAELPAEIEARCRRLSRSLGLALAGIDLRRSPDGQYYCFEANPAPQFDFYQLQTQQRIGEALVDLLCE